MPSELEPLRREMATQDRRDQEPMKPRKPSPAPGFRFLELGSSATRTSPTRAMRNAPSPATCRRTDHASIDPGVGADTQNEAGAHRAAVVQNWVHEGRMSFRINSKVLNENGFH